MITRVDIYKCIPKVEYAEEIDVNYWKSTKEAKEKIKFLKHLNAPKKVIPIRVGKNHIKVFIK